MQFVLIGQSECTGRVAEVRSDCIHSGNDRGGNAGSAKGIPTTVIGDSHSGGRVGNRGNVGTLYQAGFDAAGIPAVVTRAATLGGLFFGLDEQPNNFREAAKNDTARWIVCYDIRDADRGLVFMAYNAHLAEQFEVVQRWVAGMEIAGPGFINLRLQPAARQQVVAAIRAAGEQFGLRGANGRQVLVEFVSANPTGPLHTGHTRQACLGDAICRVLKTDFADLARQVTEAQAQRQMLSPDSPPELNAAAPFVLAGGVGLAVGGYLGALVAHDPDGDAPLSYQWWTLRPNGTVSHTFTASGSSRTTIGSIAAVTSLPRNCSRSGV